MRKNICSPDRRLPKHKNNRPLAVVFLIFYSISGFCLAFNTTFFAIFSYISRRIFFAVITNNVAVIKTDITSATGSAR